MSILNISQHAESFRGDTYVNPRRKKMKNRSRPLYDLYQFGSNKIREFGQSFIRDYIFYASSAQFKSKMNDERLEISREILREIGGVSVILEHPNETHIEAMYFDVRNFKEILIEMGAEFIHSPDGESYSIRSHNAELTELLRKMRLAPSNLDENEFPVAGFTNNPPLLEEQKPGVTILTQGNACIFEMDRGSIISTLVSGQNCIAYNIQGTGRSEGFPSEERTFQDIETIYQYLKSKGFKDREITAKGYCLGGGQASELAKRHPINLSLDRTFSSVSSMVGEVAKDILVEKAEQSSHFKYLSTPIEKLTPSIVGSFINRFVISYPVEENIKEVKGHAHIADATKDDVIPTGTGDRLFARLQQDSSKIFSRLVLEDHEHCDTWNLDYKRQYHDHLNRADLLRDLGHREPLPAPSIFELPTQLSKSLSGATKAVVTDIPKHVSETASDYSAFHSD